MQTTTSPAKLLSPVTAYDFLPPISGWVKFGGLIIIGTASLAIALSAVAKYKITVKSQGIIRPTGELRVVQAATNGTVLKISVTENQRVHKGDVIAILDSSQLQTKKQQLQTNIQQSQLQVLQLNAQIRAIENQLAAEADRIYGAIAASESELTRRQREHRDRDVTSVTTVDAAQAKLQSAIATQAMAKQKWERYEPLAQSGAISQDRLDEARLAVQQQQQEVLAAKAEWQRAQAALNPTTAEVTIALEQIAQERARGVATIATLHREREALIQQRIQIQNQIAQSHQDLNQVNQDLTKTTVTATADGIVTKLNLRNSDQTVQAGQEIAKIVPQDAKLLMKATVTAQDIDQVKVGQLAQMRVSACPYPDYGTLNGVVRMVAPDATVPQRSGEPSEAAPSVTNEGVAPVYEVTIEPDQLRLTQRQKTCQIQLGMEGRIDIISKEETILRWLLRRARFIADVS